MKKALWFFSGIISGVFSLSIAMGSVPSHVTDDTAIYQKLSEIPIAKETSLNFDSDISHLSQIEGSYRESLPSLARNSKLQQPMKRISQQKYQYSSGQKPPVAQN